jgi:D-serine deaminase-like pyridoxal phosphate-dependent protein
MRTIDLDTPALLCDLDVLDANLTLMADRCRSLDIALRPHTKSHKIPEIAHLQIAHGAKGITCQKLGEAEAMVAGGLDDIFIAYNIVGSAKTERLARLAKSRKIRVAVDSAVTAEGISAAAAEIGATVEIIVELDTGSHRCGVQSPADAAELAKRIEELPGLQFMGIMTYPSRETARPFIDETVGALSASGIECNVISGGGTGSEAASKAMGCTETRSGSYVWEGGTRVGQTSDLSPERCPVRLLCTVVSTSVPGQAVLDAGKKALTAMSDSPFGLIIEQPAAKIRGMSVEHGHVDISECPAEIHVGDRLSVIPKHGGMTTNLHDTIYGVRGETIEAIWKVAGRGKSQ